MADQHEWSDLFSNAPREDQMPIRWEVLRCPPKGFANLIVLSSDVVGAPTHYWGNRTIPCLEGRCPACEQNQEPRWRGYLAITNDQLSARGLVELTPSAMVPIRELRSKVRSLRGCKLSMHRKGGKINGRLFAEIRETRLNTEALPKAPSLIQCLARMWQLRRTPDGLTIVAPEFQEPPKRQADFGEEKTA